MRNTLSVVVVALFLASCSTTPSSNAPSIVGSGKTERHGKFEVIPFVGDYIVKRAIYPNGLKLVVLRDSSSPTFAYQTWFNVGSRNEMRGRTGLAHLFEHMMFKGTRKHKEGQFDALLEAAGAEDENAFTSHDHTVYVQNLPKAALDLIIELESDRMVNLIVDDKSFKTEREVVKNERRFRNDNSPEGKMDETLFGTAYTSHSYRWPVIGYEQDLNIMSAQDAREFYRNYYSPDRATIVVVGDVDPDEVYYKVEKAYGSIPAKNLEDAPIKPEPEQVAQRRKRLELNLNIEKLIIAYKIPALNDEDTPVFDMIQSLLSDGRGSRLNRALVDAGIASTVDSGSYGLRDPGLFVVAASLQAGKGSPIAESIILRELERLKSNPVTVDELKRALNVGRFRFLQHLTASSNKANFLGHCETDMPNLEACLDFQRKVEAVTPEQVQAVAKKYFNTKTMTVITAVPKAKKE